jgi:hypothetical protein
MPLMLIDTRASHRAAPPQRIQREIRQTAPDLIRANTKTSLKRPINSDLKASGRSHLQHGTPAAGRIRRPPAASP